MGNYIIGKWSGLPNYECELCDQFKTLNIEHLKVHMLDRHGEPAVETIKAKLNKPSRAVKLKITTTTPKKTKQIKESTNDKPNKKLFNL